MIIGGVMVEQRKSKRLDLKVQLELERLDQDDVTTVKYVEVDVQNLSRSGIGFTSKQELEVDSFYNTKLIIWTREVIDVVIRIVRRKDGEGEFFYGAEFIGMTETDTLKIDIYQIVNEA